MSRDLDAAQRQFASGQLRKAVESLYYVLPKCADDTDEAEGLLALATMIRDTGEKRLKGDCNDLIGSAEAALRRLAEEGLTNGALAVVSRCQVLGGHGLLPDTEASCDLIFHEDALVLFGARNEPISVPYSDVTAFEIGGPGARKSGGGFIGG